MTCRHKVGDTITCGSETLYRHVSEKPAVEFIEHLIAMHPPPHGPVHVVAIFSVFADFKCPGNSECEHVRTWWRVTVRPVVRSWMVLHELGASQ